ncbi:MAG: hypothetical protein ACRBFS_19005 [Aureispira sp.]
MKTYENHIKSIQQVGETLDVNYKPVFRASAIFPVLHTEHFSSEILFLGYWLLKRKIKEIGLVITLRSEEGNILKRRNLTIDCVKAFSIRLSSLLENVEGIFYGSIELEVFSSKDMVFPYPAFVVTYYNEFFSTAVHTTGRVYNDIEDFNNNNNIRVAESGFDIYADDNLSPFIAFVNGPVEVKTPVFNCLITNSNGQDKKMSFSMNSIDKYQTCFVQLDDYIEGLGTFLGGQPGSIKIHHEFTSFFPRFIAGNFQKAPNLMSITHTYYDCSASDGSAHYWTRDQGEHHQSSTMVPLLLKKDYYTNLALYPIFSPSTYYISFEFFDEVGTLLHCLEKYQCVKSVDSEYRLIKFKEIVANFDWKDQVASTRIIINWEEGKIPTRLKLGLNVGMENQETQLPCNICFAPTIGNPRIDQKTGTFKWSPIINKGNSILYFLNAPTHKKVFKEATIDMKIYRESDNECLKRTIQLAPFQQNKIDLAEDEELRNFLQGESGWVAANADNPYVNGWYFDVGASGLIAGDHSF